MIRDQGDTIDDALAAIRRCAGMVTDYVEADSDDRGYIAQAITESVGELIDTQQTEALVGLLDLPRDRRTVPIIDDVGAALVACGPAAVEPLLRVAAGQPLTDDDVTWRGWDSAVDAAATVLGSMNESDQTLGLVEVLAGESGDVVKSMAAELLVALGAAAVDDLQEALGDPVARDWAKQALAAIAEHPGEDRDTSGFEELVDDGTDGTAIPEPRELPERDSGDTQVRPVPGPITDPEIARLLGLLALPDAPGASDSFHALAEELAAGGPETVARLLEVKARGDAHVGQRVGLVFDQMSTDALFAGLFSVLLTDPDPVRRQASVIELEAMGPAATDRLEALREDERLGALAGLCLDGLVPVQATPVEGEEYDAVRVSAPVADPTAVRAMADAYFEAETDEDARYALDELAAVGRASRETMADGTREGFREIVDRLLDAYFADENDGDAAWALDSLGALVDACGPGVADVVLEQSAEISGVAELRALRAQAADALRSAPDADDAARRRTDAVARIVAGEGMQSG